jgi:hypothetical protein
MFRQLHDMIGGLLQGREPAAAGKRDRVIERGRPGHRALDVAIALSARLSGLLGARG